MILLIPILIALGTAGCLASRDEEKKDEKEGDKPPCRPKSSSKTRDDAIQKELSQPGASYTSHSFTGRFSPSGKTKQLDVFLDASLSPRTAAYVKEQFFNCGGRALQEMGESQTKQDQYNLFVGPFPNDLWNGSTGNFSGVIRLKNSLFQYLPTNWSLGDTRCLEPTIAHEGVHAFRFGGSLSNITEASPENRVLEEGYATKIEADTSGDPIQVMEEIEIDSSQGNDIEVALQRLRSDNEEMLTARLVTEERETANGTSRILYFRPSNSSSSIIHGLTIQSAGRPVDNCINASEAPELLKIGIRTLCYLHDRTILNLPLESGTLFLISENLSDYFRNDRGGGFTCGTQGASDTQNVHLGNGRRITYDTNDFISYGISIDPETGYVDHGTYLTGACFWESVEEDFGKSALQKTIQVLRQAGEQYEGHAVNVISLIAQGLETPESEVEDRMRRFNISPEIFRDQFITPICSASN